MILPVYLMAADRVVYANATLDIEPGARSAALGSATMAVDGDYLGLNSNPYQLSELRYAWFSFSHTAYFEDTQYDFATAVVPLGQNQGLGISFSRFGANDIPYIKEGEPIPEGSDYNTLSVADYTFSATWGRRIFKRLDLGVGFHGLYREMDQTGWGFRSDVGLRYGITDAWRVSGLLKGWSSSATTWESGTVEYSSPELYLATSYSLPVPYLYGRLNMYWQGAGLFHHEARALDFETDEDVGGRLWDDPVDWLSGGRGGLEFEFDFGLSLRCGLSSFTTFQSVTAGAGLTIAKFLKVDYAFESHPVLSAVHRLSISVSPYLFAHQPKPDDSRYYDRRLENVAQEEDKSFEENSDLEGSGNGEELSGISTDPKSSQSQESKPVDENSGTKVPSAIDENREDEVLEPSGVTFWEED